MAGPLATEAEHSPKLPTAHTLSPYAQQPRGINVLPEPPDLLDASTPRMASRAAVLRPTAVNHGARLARGYECHNRRRNLVGPQGAVIYQDGGPPMNAYPPQGGSYSGSG